MPEITKKPEFDYFKLIAAEDAGGKGRVKPHKKPPPIENFPFPEGKNIAPENSYKMVFLRKGDEKNPSDHDLLVIFDNNHNFHGALIGGRATKFFGGSFPFNIKDGGMFLDAVAIADSTGNIHSIQPAEIGFLLTNTIRMVGIRDDYSNEMHSLINKIQGINYSNILKKHQTNITTSIPETPSKLGDLCQNCHDVTETSTHTFTPTPQKTSPLADIRR